MFFKTLITSLLSALALTTPGTIADQGADSNQVDLPRGNAVDSYVPMSTNAELDMHDALKKKGEQNNLENTKTSGLKGEILSGSCGTNVNWTLDTSTGLLKISGNGSISGSLFGYRNQIKKVVIENGVTSIGKEVFQNFESLSSVEIPSSVTSIGEQAFSWCTSLSSIEIPSSVTSIGNGTFFGCKSLRSIKIPSDSKLVSIGDYAFRRCTSLSSIEIPSSVTSIGEGTFCECENLSL